MLTYSFVQWQVVAHRFEHNGLGAWRFRQASEERWGDWIGGPFRTAVGTGNDADSLRQKVDIIEY